MKQFKSLMSNVGAIDGRYGVRFIHAAIKSLSKKKGLHMQVLECRLWLVGLICDPETREDTESFVKEYFEQLSDESLVAEEKRCLEKEYQIYKSIVNQISK